MNENEDFSGRLQFLSFVLVLIIAVLIGRAGYLQVYEGEFYARLAEGNRIRVIPSEAARGTFYDRNGELPRFCGVAASSDRINFARGNCTRIKAHQCTCGGDSAED